MQTFLPDPCYLKSARYLDSKRLGNQFYRDGLTLLRGGWPKHPAARMWQGKHWHLGLYLLACYEELRRRGRDYPHHAREVRERMARCEDRSPPCWLDDPAFHAAHRSNLLRKDPVWYGRFGWTEPHDLPYVWPTNP